MVYVYLLKDYKGFYFYIGLTKNLATRIGEHIKCKGNNPAKNYRVRRCIQEHGELDFDHYEFETLADARAFEKKQIERFLHQLVNVQHGKNKKRVARTRKSGRSVQCPTCGNWFKRIKAHKCKAKD